MSQASTAISDDERKRKPRKSKHLTAHQQHVIETVKADPKALMDSLAVRTFCGDKGVSTFHRWRNDPDPDRRFPAPDYYIGPTAYWRRETVLGWLERQADQRTARLQVIKANSSAAITPPAAALTGRRHGDPAAVIAAGVGQAFGVRREGTGTPDGVEAMTHAKTSLCNIDQS